MFMACNKHQGRDLRLYPMICACQICAGEEEMHVAGIISITASAGL